MNKLVIPSSPNWYEADIMACAPDNSLIYGSRQDLVVVKPTPSDQPDDVHIVTKPHAMKITSVNINRNWGAPHKYAVTTSEDKVIKLWDMENVEKKISHNAHTSIDKSRVVGASFAGDDRVVSASENGAVVIWNLLKNEINVLNTLFNSKATVTCLSVCPHANWLAAFGLKSGLIVVADLRKTGKFLYNLRGHSKSVISLAWCPAPVNIFPIKPLNRVTEKHDEVEVLACDEEERVSKRKQKMPCKISVSVTENLITQDLGESDVVSKDNFRKSAIANSCTQNGSGAQLKSKRQKFKVSDMLPSKDEGALTSPVTVSLESSHSPPKNDTPTNRDIIPMDISPKIYKSPKSMDTDDAPGALEQNDTPTNREVIPMDICHSTQKIDKTLPSTNSSEESLKVFVSSSSEEGRGFSTASSCENDLNCSKRQKENLNQPDLDEVFHDAHTEKDVENWRAKEPEGVDEEPRKEFLLASSAREPNIYIWRAGTDGRMQTFMTVPSPKKSQHYKKSSTAQSERLWITLCWVAPHLLLSSSRSAELLKWTLPKPMNQAKFFHLVHKDHWSVLFSIKAPIIYKNENNFLQQQDVNVWTTGMDRMIINTDLKTMKNLACYPALGSSVNCMAASPLDPNRLAIGTGEGLINTWDLGRPHKKSFAFGSFYQKILSAVTALAWHPTNETSLAFGTTEGRVGVFDVINKSKQPKILPQFFKTQIFKLEWGPSDAEVEKQKLFVVGEGNVAVFDVKSKEKDPEMLELPDKTDVYTMAWKPNYSQLLVASKNHTLISYSPDLRILNVRYITHNLQSILWHPDAASDDTSVSKYCSAFVSIVKHNELVVFDLSRGEDIVVVAAFENRGVKIGDVAWSPHCGNHLVVVDDGGIAQVYDVETKTAIATYVNPCLDHLLSVYWSPVDPDYIIVGTGFQKIIVWQVSQHAALTDSEINTQKNRIVKAQQKATDFVGKEKEPTPLTEKGEGDVAKAKTLRKYQVAPLFYSVRESTAVEDMRKLLQWKQGNREGEASANNNNRLDVLDVFGDESNLDRVFQLNLSSFKQQGKYQQGNLLKLLQGDVSTTVKEAIEQKRVNPWIISLCPMVSPKLWQTACETYVQQLLDEPEADPLEVVTYLLACHKIEDCVKFLCEQQMFREALLLAKARFGADNPMVADVLEKFAKHCTYQGNFELAACCYITLGKFEEAASVLFRRSSVELLEVAEEIAGLCGNEELHKAVVFRLKAFKTESSEVSVATEGATLEPVVVEKTIESEIVKEDSPVSQTATSNNIVDIKIVVEEVGDYDPSCESVESCKEISNTCEQRNSGDASSIEEETPIVPVEKVETQRQASNEETGHQDPEERLNSESEKAVVETDSDKAVVETESQKVVETDSEKAVVETDSDKAVVETESQKVVVETDSEKAVVETDADKAVVETESQKVVVETDSEKAVVETDSEKAVVETDSKKAVVKTESQEAVVKTESEKAVVKTESPKAVVETESKSCKYISKKSEQGHVTHSQEDTN